MDMTHPLTEFPATVELTSLSLGGLSISVCGQLLGEIDRGLNWVKPMPAIECDDPSTKTYTGSSGWIATLTPCPSQGGLQ